jgi:hypothetical protein
MPRILRRRHIAAGKNIQLKRNHPQAIQERGPHYSTSGMAILISVGAAANSPSKIIAVTNRFEFIPFLPIAGEGN